MPIATKISLAKVPIMLCESACRHTNPVAAETIWRAVMITRSGVSAGQNVATPPRQQTHCGSIMALTWGYGKVSKRTPCTRGSRLKIYPRIQSTPRSPAPAS